MLRVYKRSGRIETFDNHRLITSLLNTGYDMNFTLNQRESELLVEEIKDKIIDIRGEDGLTSTFEIRALVTYILRKRGYSDLAYHYYKNRFN